MFQVVQNISSGKTEILEVPKPLKPPHHSLIKAHFSLISSGTEKMLVDFGKSGLIGKALGQPEKVKMVLEKVKTDGIAATYTSVKSKLDEPMQLGYCSVGTLYESTIPGVPNTTRVVSNGKHASLVSVPNNLIAKVPDDVSDEEAVFTVLGAIALQGVRLINPTIGETIVVTGLGLVGLLAVQILKANGCRVLAVDYDSSRCQLAKKFGAEIVDLSDGANLIDVASKFSRGQGVDGVLISASAKSSLVVHQAATICRKRGRIVLVGVVGLELKRSDFYEKELSFQVSCSYGPGRYDSAYEEGGIDYPFAFVRWTEKRNFEAVLDLMSSGAINVRPLISSRFSIFNAEKAYSKLHDKSTLGILLDYGASGKKEDSKTKVLLSEPRLSGHSNENVAFIGGGNYASRVLIPSFQQAGARFTTLITGGGVSGVHHGKKNGFISASTDINDALTKDSNAVVIVTQHNMHASQAIDVLNAGKHVFIEKPLALTHAEINDVEAAQEKSKSILMVGYNRRFSPLITKMKALLDQKNSSKTFLMTMNAGSIAADHWVHDPTKGGGRIIGEACHYIDLMRFLSGSKIISHHAVKIGGDNQDDITEDKAIITLSFEDGSIGSIHYFANGGKVFPKERIEVFCGDAVLQLDNFRKLKGFGWKGFKSMKLWSQNKGQRECSMSFMEAVRNGTPSPISLEEIFEVARVTLNIAEGLRK